jgi:hypothetical protein
VWEEVLFNEFSVESWRGGEEGGKKKKKKRSKKRIRVREV